MTGIKIEAITLGDFDRAQFQTWLGDTSPELFREYLRPSSKARSELLSDRFHNLFTKADAEIQICKRGHDCLAVIGFERQEWDSQHFGIECGRLSPYCISPELSRAEQSEVHKLMLGSGIEWGRRNKIEVLQRRLLSSRLYEINVLESLGFHMADNVVTLVAPIKNVLSASKGHEQGNDLTFRPPAKSDLDVIISMTRGVFPYSRFTNDPVLPASLGDDLYLKWVAGLFKDVTGINTDMSVEQGIVVAQVKDRIAGYVAYKIDRALASILGKCIATIELIVVDPAFQGLGIGQGLFREAACRSSELGADLLESSTWINQRLAMASNQKAGLRVCENLFTYHLYL